MNRYAAWGLSAALATGAGALAADDPAKPSEKPWYSRLAGSSSGQKPDSDKTFADVPPRPPVVYGPPDPAVMLEAFKAEKDAYLRRVDVCLKLRQIAAARNDEQLAQQAEALDKQAFALYRQRVARLGVKAPRQTAAEQLDRELVGTTDSLTVTPPEPVRAPTPETRPFREVRRD